MTSPLDAVEAALDLANDVTYGCLPGPVKAELLEQSSRIRNKVEVLDATIFATFDTSREHLAEGHASSVDWSKHHCRAKGPDAARRRKLGRRLRSMPRVAASMRRGDISHEHVDVLAWAQREVGETDFGLAESALVEAAEGLRFSDFQQTVEYFIVRCQPADAEERARRRVEDRGASSARTFGGCGRVDADFDPIGFTVWEQELQRLYQHLLEQDRAAAQAELGRRPLSTELGRTPRQRRLDAMRLMAERSAAFDGELGPSRLNVSVHCDVVLLASIIAVLRQALAGEDVDVEAALDGIELTGDSLHELDDGTVVTVNTIVLALMTGTVRGVLFDPHGEILRFGRARRCFTEAQHLALHAKYRRCCHPYGCDRRPPFVQADHVHEHLDGGPTDLTNGQILEGAHNIWKTNHKGKAPPPGPTDTGQRRRPPVIGPPRRTRIDAQPLVRSA